MMSPIQIIWFFLLFFYLTEFVPQSFTQLRTLCLMNLSFRSLLKQSKFCSLCGNQIIETFEKNRSSSSIQLISVQYCSELFCY